MALKGRTTTKAEKDWMNKVAEFGCVVCWMHHGIPHSPCEIHHIEGKTKDGAHFSVLGLCMRHHRDQSNSPLWTSRHKNKTRFEERYGTEKYLLKYTQQLLSN